MDNYCKWGGGNHQPIGSLVSKSGTVLPFLFPRKYRHCPDLRRWHCQAPQTLATYLSSSWMARMPRELGIERIQLPPSKLSSQNSLERRIMIFLVYDFYRFWEWVRSLLPMCTQGHPTCEQNIPYSNNSPVSNGPQPLSYSTPAWWL